MGGGRGTEAREPRGGPSILADLASETETASLWYKQLHVRVFRRSVIGRVPRQGQHINVLTRTVIENGVVAHALLFDRRRWPQPHV